MFQSLTCFSGTCNYAHRCKPTPVSSGTTIWRHCNSATFAMPLTGYWWQCMPWFCSSTLTDFADRWFKSQVPCWLSCLSEPQTYTFHNYNLLNLSVPLKRLSLWNFLTKIIWLLNGWKIHKISLSLTHTCTRAHTHTHTHVNIESFLSH